MRSKEVENSIKELTEIIELSKEEIENNYENITAILDIVDLKSLKTLLNYISELEEKVNTIDTQFIHKDKVFEIVELMNKHIDIYNDTVDKFNKLLEVK